VEFVYKSEWTYGSLPPLSIRNPTHRSRSKIYTAYRLSQAHTMKNVFTFLVSLWLGHTLALCGVITVPGNDVTQQVFKFYN